MTQDPQLEPSQRAGSAGVRLEPRPAAGADLTGALTVRPQRKAAGGAAHAPTGGTSKRCSDCAQTKPLQEFARDRSRADGLTYRCRDCRNACSRERYAPKPGPTAGRRFVEARDGDQAQARRRVNYLVEAGLMPAANELPCLDCGHEYSPGERRHEYDHYLGYAAEHHEDVQSVCTSCHHARENQRRAA